MARIHGKTQIVGVLLAVVLSLLCTATFLTGSNRAPAAPSSETAIPEVLASESSAPELSTPEPLAPEEATSEDFTSEPLTPEVLAPPESLNSQATNTEGKLIVRFLDVGQGDCALISCDGHHMLIDGGPSRASQKVYAILKRLGIEHLDYIVATHADADHIGGISAALNVASCGTCYCSVAEGDTRTFKSMTRYASDVGSPVTVPDIPTTLSLGSASLSIIGPTRPFPASDNNGSLICRIDYGSTSFLFMGDAEFEAEQALLDAGVELSADVVKIAHHGSAHSSSEAFLRAVNPRYAVISVGGDNPYGHPSEKVLGFLDRSGVDVFRTDTMGEILAFSNGSDVQIVATKENINV